MSSEITEKRITIGKKETGSKPIHIQMEGAESSLQVHVEQGCRGLLFDASTSVLHSVAVTLEPGAMLTYVSLAVSSARRLSSVVGEGAQIHWHCTTVGGSGESDLVSTLTGPHARSSVDWIFHQRGSERQRIAVRNIFKAPNGGGEITLKGIAEDKSHCICTGMIEIAEEGRGTDTYLTEEVLMLDPTATVDAIPALEIRTNDVKASHSATVSRITAEDLFYLRSRGLDLGASRQMFIEGFLSGLTEKIGDATLRARIQDALFSVGHQRIA
jgi:Fe-S cluster assembly scaffold protein SufB